MSITAERDHRRTAIGPFKFLDFYTEADEALFAGRDRELQRVTAELLQGRLFVLYGRSGIGKTSLLRAGLFPALSRRGYRPLYVRVLTDPLKDLHRALATAANGTGEGGGTLDEDLHTLVARLGSDKPLVLVLDQFEELFTRFRGEADRRRKLAVTLAGLLADPRLDLRILFSLRQEYLAEMDELRDVLPELFERELRIRSLSAFGARRAIANLLDAARVDYEPQLLIRIVDKLDAYGFDPTILQILCTAVYEHAAARSPDAVRLTVDDLLEVGDLKDLFLESLNRVAAALPQELRLITGAVLESLVTRERTKQAVTLPDFVHFGFRASEEHLRAVLEALVDQRLVRADRRDSEHWYELVHERLVPVVSEWLDLDEDFLRFRLARNLVENMSRGEAWREQPEALATGGQLELVEPFRETLRLDRTQLEFLLRSAIHRRAAGAFVYWARRRGASWCETLLRDLLGGDDPAARVSAAWAVRYIPRAPLTARCAELALHDEDPDVRKAACETLAETGGWADGEELRKALARRETREAAFEGLVSLYRADSPLPRLSRWRRWWVAHTARRRVGQEHAERFRRCAKAGARQGTAAAVVWLFLVGLPLLLLTSWSMGQLWTGRAGLGGGWLAILIGISLPVATGIAALVGWRLGRGAAREWTLRPSASWFRVALRDPTLLYLLLLPCTLIASALAIELPLGCVVAVLLGPLLAGLVLVVAVSLASLAAPAARHARSGFEVWSWSLLAGAGLPLFIVFTLALAVELAARMFGTPPFGLPVIATGVAAFLSFVSFFLVRVLDRVGVPIDRPRTESGNRTLWTRTASVLAVAALIGGYLARVGADTIPFTRQTIRLTPGSPPMPFLDRLGPGHPDTDYYLLRTTEPLTVLRQGGEAVSVPLSLTGAALGEDLLLVPPTFGFLRVGPLESPAPSYEGSYEFEIETPPIHSLDVPLRLAGDSWSFARLDLPLEPASGDARAVVGRLEEGTWTDDQTVEVLVFGEYPRGSGIGLEGSGPGTGVELELHVIRLQSPLAIRFVPGSRKAELPSSVTDSARSFAVAIDEGGEWSFEGYLTKKPSMEREEAHEVALVVALRLGEREEREALDELREATSLVLVDDPEGAASRFARATELVKTTTDSALVLTACRRGTLAGFAEPVADSCRRAVELRPDDDEAHLLRGVNRALLDDLPGAAADLRRAVELRPRADSWWRTRIEQYAESLEADQNPFDSAELLSLEQYLTATRSR